MRFPTTAALVGLMVGAPALANKCYDVGHGQPTSLTGVLDYVIFAGPPNYEDVQKGDTPEPNYVLRLSEPICLTGDPGFADTIGTFSTVQVVGMKVTTPQLRAHLHRRVTLTLTDAMAAETGHHHEPLVAWVTSVRPAKGRSISFLDEYGTAATAIRAFYDALHDGQGAVASSLIVAEKRSLPSFSPAGLSRFYGSLREHIRLVDVAQTGAEHYVVHYQYRASSSTCNGRADIATAVRNGRNYIQSIRPLNGC